METVNRGLGCREGRTGREQTIFRTVKIFYIIL